MAKNLYTKAKMNEIVSLIAATMDNQNELINALSVIPTHERSAQQKQLIEIASGKLCALEDVMQAIFGNMVSLRISAGKE